MIDENNQNHRNVIDSDSVCIDMYKTFDESEDVLFDGVQTINPKEVSDSWELLASDTFVDEVLDYHKLVQVVLRSQIAKRLKLGVG